MPANKKYLTQNGWQRFAKFTAGFIGGYMISVSFHLALATFLNRPNTLITTAYSGFLVWAVCMMLAFFFKNGLKAWAVYLLITLICSLAVYFG